MTLSDAISVLAADRLLPAFVAVFAICLLAEHAVSARRGLGFYARADTAASLALGGLSALVEIPLKALWLVAYVGLYEASPLKDAVGRSAPAWVLLFFADDLTYYVFHRANHEVRLFWAGHVPHHSSTYFNFATALRQGVGERLHKFLFWAWLPLAGFHPLMVLTMMTLSLFYQFFVHTQFVGRLPAPLEWILNTPSHHRVHHASNAEYLDRNHAGVLIVWDRLFGTFVAEQDAVPPRYGLTKRVETHHPLRLATDEYRAMFRDMRRAPRLSDKLRTLWLAPGWSHDGPDRRVNRGRPLG